MYLVTTEHLEDGLWFRDEEDFRVAMNYVAIQAASSPEVIVLAFILMSNHVHFVLIGTEKDVRAFVERFKARYSLYLRRKYGSGEFLRRNKVKVQEIPCGNGVRPEDEDAVEKAIAYVHMNCVAANICSSPNQYPWGSGNCFFNSTPRSGKPVAELSGRARKRLFRTENVCLPDNWKVNDAGYIPPEEYVDVKAVERIFRTPRRMNYYLANSSKAKKRMERDDNLPSFKDQSILAALPDLCRSLFGKRRFNELSLEEKREFARQIRYRFSAEPNQIARVCGMTYAEAAQLLDSV